MGFTTVIFLCAFFPLIILSMFLCSRFHLIKGKNILLFCISILFYAFSGLYSLVMVSLLTIVTYFGITKYTRRKQWVTANIVICIMALVLFKYSGFISSNVFSIMELLGLHTTNNIIEIMMPMGISFIIFSMISFQIDICRNPELANISFLEYANYIFLFPKILEGPITAYDEISGGFAEDTVSLVGIYEGTRRFMVGFSKKVILADTLSPIVAAVFNGNIHAAGYAWLGVIAYAFQLFFDFSGYTDMAIGLGKICGFTLPENFNDPYLAVGIQDFWRRWHITLSIWFKKYIYFPLGGSRNGKWKTYRNLLIIFMLTGIWHGANWTFLIWGLWHGIFMLIERVGFGKKLKRMPSFFAHIYTLTVILFGWVLFRADSFSNAIVILKSMFGKASYAESNIIQLLNFHLIFIIFLGGLISFRIPEKILGKWGSDIPKCIKDFFVLAVFVLAVSYMVSNGYNPSIYTKF